MILDIFQIDAFTDKLFHGNQACVIPLNKWLDDELLLKIAKENAVSETAFFIKNGNYIQLRWFTPDIEIDLCGHATLAVAYVLRELYNCNLSQITFKTLSGDLFVSYDKDIYYLDLPSRMPKISLLPSEISSSLNFQPLEVFKSRDYLLVYEKELDVRNIKIDRNHFDKINLGYGGVIITSKGDNVDFVSRFFTPQATILEDPVTGSAHCSLVPFWSKRLGLKNLKAHQISERMGKLICRDLDSKVRIGGSAKLFFSGKIKL
ncbi:MAG: isomerase [Flavobacteriales bacterium]|nr:isomerase [Flavobacteriales bacterium]|tara:strand:+ start:5537 stop:6322 length:786 start_codon:yes stop_codon:yes gene_type:complete